MIFWSTACSIVGLAFAAEAMGLFAHELNTALAVLFLLMGAALDPSTRRGAPVAGRLPLGGIAAAVLGLLLVPVDPSIRFFAAALWFWGLDVVAKTRCDRQGPAAALAIGSFLFGLYRLGASSSLLSWYGLQAFSGWLSALAARLTGQPLSLGPTFCGVDMLVLAIGVCIGGFWVSQRHRRFPFILALVAVGLLHVSYLGMFARIPLALSEVDTQLTAEPSPWQKAVGDVLGLTFPVAPNGEEAAAEPSIVRLVLEKALRRIYPVHVPLLLPLLLAIPLGWYLRQLSTELRSPGPRSKSPVAQASRPCLHRRDGGATEVLGRTLQSSVSRASVMAVIVLAVIAVWSLTNVPAAARATGLNVAMYEKGFLNWGVPDHRRYGARSAGMFGNLPLLVERMGGQAEIIPAITAEALAGRDVLVVINQKDPLPADSLRAIDRFLHAGGALLVMGDHTFWKNERRVLCNEPLESSNIRLRFDSADYFIGGWLHSLAFWPHPITAELGDATNEAGSVVGASLAIHYPATPLIIGRFGYSDPGEPEAAGRGYLGNLDFDPGERLGDIVLVAAENVGRGRVVVVGDTSGFVNAIQTQTWPYVQRVFCWLGSAGHATVPWWRDLLGVGLLGALAIACLLSLGRVGGAVPVAAAALLVCGWASHRVVASVARPGPLRGDVVVVDLSHVGLHSIEGWRDDGIAGVYLNLMREGFFAIGARDFDARQIEASELFITIAPTQPYSRGELRILRQFMEGGGTVLLCVGWEDRSGAASLLDMVGLRLAHRPLGRAASPVPGTDVQPMFWSAWPVLGGETIVTLRGEPVIVRKAVGDGQIVVIGDSEFLLNKNLEGEKGAVMQSVRFFGWLLNHILERESA